MFAIRQGMAPVFADLSMHSTHFAYTSIFIEKIDMFYEYIHAFDTSAHQLQLSVIATDGRIIRSNHQAIIVLPDRFTEPAYGTLQILLGHGLY